MLFDRAKIFIQAGAGGDGAVSFRREAHVPKGGPDGGDGGRGGDVVLVCDPDLRDLQPFRRRAHFRAGRGGHGEGGQRHGASAEALRVSVPPGAVVEDPERGTRYDLTRPGERAVVARGGAGGRGNARFATPNRQVPRFAERGLAGEEGWLEVRLKLLADVGLVGLPNAGKSSLLARLTRARPKVAPYPFTTLEPVLGTLDAPDRQLVVADIPGLLEGASEGTGLGHAFLAHVERTELLVHVLDLAPLDGSDAVANHAIVESELTSYGAGVERRPRILCLSKADLVPEERAVAAAEEWRERLDVGSEPDGWSDAVEEAEPGGGVLEVVVTSAATGAGVDDLAAAILRVVPAEPSGVARAGAGGPGAAAAAATEEPGLEALAEHRVYRPGGDEGFSVEPAGARAFRVVGRGVERLIARHDLENEEALDYVEGRLRDMGVISALEAAGFTPGDDVEIGGVAFELDPARA